MQFTTFTDNTDFVRYSDKKNRFFSLNILSLLFSSFFCCSGMDIRRCVVFDMAGSWCMDVYGVHLEFMCDIIGPLCGGYTTRHLSQHHVNETSKVIGSRCLGAVIRYLPAPISWLN